uniref:Phragmoplast orienting kinesin-1 isoform X1 n=1 Tax=Populus alba TaxID=43335 RepID=A0A4U5MWG6_POPAL|nr:phragmoplast orienting kinesin-1 isoform X1 [Populus alba]
MSSSRLTVARNPHSSNQQEEPSTKENEFETSLNSSGHFPPQRTPLNSIPDPTQCHKETHESGFDGKLETTRSGRFSTGTPRFLIRHGKAAQSEPNSAHNTPARSASRASLGGALGGYATGTRSLQFTKGKDVSFSSSRVSRGISVANSDFSVEVPHFELEEDPSFWKDHNVQVMIRIRPLSNIEKVSQGHGRCLKQESGQTLVWLGHPETRFTFDHVSCETISQEKLFKVAGLPMVENCMSGYNSCMFAYGQTGSGKTYTMMGEINQVECNLSADCGITPRIFEHLFSRIRMEEENRRDEKLRFSCKCSFLEIYNEQITDLLEPSSTNLQLREDLNKGVYVENLTEYNVRTVNDVIKLLQQGAANRKMAATYMNSESSRSHSVFTCVIESWWEKDSMNHFRFARLNLVDLAGSERQKSSGAEGDRLKEAANINKSLSTLGWVIMSLVDLAHGKHKHVPYRDSRLTFLLQDSLGGNSKTTIIANVSPSTCSAHETLSTLKFAQRAKLIQNNAKVNEDASGDVGALQKQIQQLKDQLSFLMKHHNLSRPHLSCMPSSEGPKLADHSSEDRRIIDNHSMLSTENKKVKCMEAILSGALRREKLAETAFQKLENEMEHVNQLSLMDGSLPADHYLMEENKALKEEIQLLQPRLDKSPELTRFALENMRLLEQLQLFQKFYEQGEREMLLGEISELRDQLLVELERNLKFSSRHESQDNDTVKELEDCRNMDSKLMREVDELQELKIHLNNSQAAYDKGTDSFSKDPEEIRQIDKCSLVEMISEGSEWGDEMTFFTPTDYISLQNKNNLRTSAASIHSGNTQAELMEARLLIQAMESEQVRLIEELQLMQGHNNMYIEILKKKDNKVRESVLESGSNCLELLNLKEQNEVLVMEGRREIKSNPLQVKLDKLNKDLEEARSLNYHYQEDQASKLYQQHQAELVCEEVETETTRTILHLQEEISALQLELDERLYCMTQENTGLRNTVAAKEAEIRALCGEWERATLELTSFLTEGSKSLKDASGQIESIANAFPKLNVWIGEHAERAARACVDKEETILQLEKSLEDARKMVMDMEMKLNSLREATMALNDFPQSDNDESSEETIHSTMQLNEKINMKKRADAAFLVIKWLSECHKVAHSDDVRRRIPISKLLSSTNMGYRNTFDEKVDAWSDNDAPIGWENLILESENVITASYKDVEVHVAALQAEVLADFASYRDLVQDLVKEIHEMKSKIMELKERQMDFQSSTMNWKAWEPLEFLKFDNQLHILQLIRVELAKINDRMEIVSDFVDKKISSHNCLLNKEDFVEADGWSTDSSASCYSMIGSDLFPESVSLGNKLDGKSHGCCSKLSRKITEQMDLESRKGSVVQSESEDFQSGSEYSEKLLKIPHPNRTMTLEMKRELDLTFDTFSKIYVHLSKIFNEDDLMHCTCPEDIKESFPSLGSRMKIAEAFCQSTGKVLADDKVSHASIFLRKCEEANATMKEADYMLNALMEANENAKQSSDMWKQANDELVADRSRLVEENGQLKSSLCLKEEENKLLLDENSLGLAEVANSVSLLESCFLQMQREEEERYKVIYSDVLSVGREMLSFICNSRSSVEDIFSEIMEKGFARSIIYHCLVGEVFHKTPSFIAQPRFSSFSQQERHMVMDTSQRVCSTGHAESIVTNKQGNEEQRLRDSFTTLEEGEGPSHNLMYENSSLKKELERKESLLKGLLFDFSLLQETASNRTDFKDETEKLIFALSEVQHELEKKTSQIDDLLVQHRKVEGYLTDTENALSVSITDLAQAKETIDTLSDENAELRMLLKDIYLKKSEAEEQLEEQKEVTKSLEDEIIHLTYSTESKLRSAVESLEEELEKIRNERDQLREEIRSFNDKLEMAYGLADENEAIAVEARQESEASKIYAEQKEEEVKILEHSVEELENTINVLEKKVYEMNDEVERHRLIRDSLELELRTLRQRLSTVENITDIADSENANSVQKEDSITRQLHNRLLELHGAYNRIRLLERDITEKDKEIKQCKEYISELVLHSEAQASQFQEKYKTLETMVREVQTYSLDSASALQAVEKSEKSSIRTRGSSSPFRCIAGLVQQMSLEKDQELTVARLRIEELEAVLSSRKKEVCALNARLAAAESMTHDVIRDLLGVKLDMTNYANLIDQHQVQKLVEDAHQQTEEFLAREQEILNLRKQINDLTEERESCIAEINLKVADMLAAQMAVEQLNERDQLLSAQNEMLKVDKSNLLRRVAELDEMVKTLLGTQITQQRVPPTSSAKEKRVLKSGGADLTKRLAHSEKLLSRVNNELSQYRSRSDASHPYVRTNGQGLELNNRKDKA